jgi:hypothetical protein
VLNLDSRSLSLDWQTQSQSQSRQWDSFSESLLYWRRLAFNEAVAKSVEITGSLWLALWVRINTDVPELSACVRDDFLHGWLRGYVTRSRAIRRRGVEKHETIAFIITTCWHYLGLTRLVCNIDGSEWSPMPFHSTVESRYNCQIRRWTRTIITPLFVSPPMGHETCSVEISLQHHWLSHSVIGIIIGLAVIFSLLIDGSEWSDHHFFIAVLTFFLASSCNSCDCAISADIMSMKPDKSVASSSHRVYQPHWTLIDTWVMLLRWNRTIICNCYDCQWHWVSFVIALDLVRQVRAQHEREVNTPLVNRAILSLQRLCGLTLACFDRALIASVNRHCSCCFGVKGSSAVNVFHLCW